MHRPSPLLLVLSLLVFPSLLAAFLQTAEPAAPCKARHYNFDSFVCVCNATYCDSLPHLPATAPGLVTTYQSDRRANRFATGQLAFRKKAVNLTDGVVVDIDRGRTFQTLLGFGGAFTDAAGLNLKNLGEKLARNAIRDYFGPSGLRYSMGRVPIGGSDFSTRAYTYDDGEEEDLELVNWKLQPEDVQYKIPLIQQALQEATGQVRLIATPWSAPAWMKTNGRLNGKGSLKGDPTGAYYRTWAEYFVKFLDAYKRNNIDFWGITVQNEPLDGRIENFAFNSLGMTAAQQRDFVFKTLGPRLNASGYGLDRLKLMIFDDQRSMIKLWADTILSEAEAKLYVSGMAFHWYTNPISPAEVLDEVHAKYPHFFLISSEACEGSSPLERSHVELGAWGRAESYAYDIIKDLQHHTSAWIDWNLAVDLEGGPNWVANFVDAPVIVNASAGEYLKQPMYYALAHFTRFLEPGSIRLGSTQNKNALEVVVFSTPSHSTVAIVLNRFQSSIPLQLNDPKYGALQTTIDAHSITTFVWYD